MKSALYYILLIFFSISGCNNAPEQKMTKSTDYTLISTKDLYKKTVKKTVTILTDKGLGSGFFIDSNIIVTNYHVISNAEKINVKLDDSEETYPIDHYFAIDKHNDLILLEFNKSKYGFLKIIMKWTYD